ncbi:MAG: hypothetical protein AB7G44_02860 [Bacteroidia bacterium]
MSSILFFHNKPFFSGRKFIGLSVAITVLLYFNTLFNGYNVDDDLVTINHRLTSKGISAILEIFTSPYFQDEMKYSFEYRPITLTSFAIEYHFFGDNPFVSHLINLFLYVFCVIVFIKIMRQLTFEQNNLLLIISTLIFIVHPMHTEVVASIKNRDELLSLLFAMLAFYNAILFVKNNGFLNLLLIVIFFLFGVLSKNSCLPFYFVIPVGIFMLCPEYIKKVFVIVGCLSLVILFFIIIKGYPLLWAGYVIIIQIALVFSVFLFRNKEIPIKIWRVVKPSLKFSNEISINITSIEINWINLFVYFFTVMSVFTAYVVGNFIIVIPALLLLQFSIYWTKKIRIDYLILLLLIYAFSIFYGSLNFTVLLFLSYLQLVLPTAQKNVRYIFLFFASLIYTVLLMRDQNYPHLIILGIFFLSEYLANELTNKRIISYFWIVILITVCVLFGFSYSSKFSIEDIYILMMLVLWALPTFFKQFLWFKIVPVIISLLALLTIDTAIKHDDFLVDLRSKKDYKIFKNDMVDNKLDYLLIQTNKPVNNSVFAKIQTEDRPLDFIEFPLGFSPTISEKIGTISYVLGYYFKMMFVPYPMCYYYGFNKVNSKNISNPWAILSIAVYLILVLSAVYFFNKHPIYSFAVFSYLASIFLFSNMVSPVAGMIGDRLTFVASFGFCIAIGYVISSVYLSTSNYRKKVILILFFIVMLTYSGTTIARNAQWKNHMILFKHDIKHLENSAQAHNLLAKRLLLESFKEKSPKKQQEMREEGVKHFERALEIYPEFFNPMVDLGKAYLLLDRFDDASTSYLKAYQLDSTYLDALLQAGGIFMKTNKLQQAANCIETVIRKDNKHLQARTTLSEVYFRQNEIEKSIELNKKTIELFPAIYGPVVNLAKIYFATGDKNNALIYFEKAYKINPSERNLILTMANIYKEFGENQKADYYFSLVNQQPR